MSDITTTARSINTITAEIRTITQHTQQVVLSAAIEIGRRLKEAKELVPHGEWGTYLQREVEFSQSTAQNLMKVYEEYGSGQQNLFAPNSQALGNLTYTKALRLLALPAEERETFIEQNDVEKMSTRELEKALKERDEALNAAKDAQAQLRYAQDKTKQVDSRLQEQKHLTQEMEKRAKAAEDKLTEVAALKEKLKKAKDAAAQAEKELRNAKENPDIPSFVMEKLQKEAEVAATAQAQKEAEKALQAAQAQAQKAENDRKSVQEQLEAAQKAAKVSNPNLTAVQVISQRMMADWNIILGHRKAAIEEDPGNEEGIDGFLNKLLDTMLHSL